MTELRLRKELASLGAGERSDTVAELVMGIAMSHGPMVVSEVPTWLKIAEMDQYSTLLVDTSGTPVTFEELRKASGERYAEFATEERFRTQRELVTSSIERLRDEVKQAEIDLIVVIGDDQWELFGDDYVPALAVYTGETLEFTTAGKRGRYGARVGGLDDVHAGYGMDARNRWPGHQAFALHAISGLIERGFDPATINEPSAPSGLGHAFGVVECQLMQTPGALPLVPIVVNTYWPPNQMPPARCWDLGTALREVIDSFPEDLQGRGGGLRRPQPLRHRREARHADARAAARRQPEGPARPARPSPQLGQLRDPQLDLARGLLRGPLVRLG